MPCDELLRTQAYFDGEVDALSAAQIELHIEGCAECRTLLQELEQLRTALRRDVIFSRAPPELRARVISALDREIVDDARIDLPKPRIPRRPSFWSGAVTGMTGTALAAGLAFMLLMPPRIDPVLDGLISAHLRSLMPDHLIDVISTDKHTVKPWFATHADVSPVVADFAPQGYRLAGGRADYFDHQRAAVVVYQHGSHIINVFSWLQDRQGVPRDTTRNGYHLAFWQMGNLEYCAVSDAGWDAVLELKRLIQDVGAPDSRK